MPPNNTLRAVSLVQVTHMPPELLQVGQLSKAADVFSWGTILWEMFSGERAWADMLPMQVKTLANPYSLQSKEKTGTATSHKWLSGRSQSLCLLPRAED